MLTLVGLEFEGQPHSGLDDAKNIARVLLRLIADRAFVRVNEKIIIKVMLSHSNVDHSTSSKISEIFLGFNLRMWRGRLSKAKERGCRPQA